MKNNKGLSQIVTTLIIILLVFVALGVIWMVVQNLLDESTDKIADSTKCMTLDIDVKRVENISASEYNITFYRGTGGVEEEIGLKIFLKDVNGTTTNPIDTTKTWNYMQTKEVTINATLDGANLDSIKEVTYAPFFIDEETNTKSYCSTITKEIESVIGS